MTGFVCTAPSSSARRRHGLLPAVAAAVLVCPMTLAIGVSKADFPSASEGDGQRDGAIYAAHLVMFQTAPVGPAAGSGSGQARRVARSSIRSSTVTLSSAPAQGSLETVSDGLLRSYGMGEGMFDLSRSVVPLLAPQSLAASGQFVVHESLRGSPVGGTAPLKFRSAISHR